ncbi:MAG: hypothetical protein ACM31L_05895 [Actinomycetota bacterium]
MRCRPLSIAALAAALLPLAAGAAELSIDRQTVDFEPNPSAAEVKAAKRWAKKEFAQALADRRPFALSVARAGGTTMISLESVALCNAADGCPLLVFRDLAQRPVLSTMSFHNLVLEYRKSGTVLVPNRSGPRLECLLTGVYVAKCRPYRAEKRN